MSLKLLQEFPDAVFLGVDVDLQLGEEEVSSLETIVPVQKGHNFCRCFRTLFSLE
jgi:hypothetical protein